MAKFLDLPGEIRNQVYKLVTDTEPSPSILYRAQPALQDVDIYTAYKTNRFALAQTCRQIRAEYLPMCMIAADLQIRAEDKKAFFDTFYPQKDRIITRKYQPPAKLTILLGKYGTDHGSGLGILPFVQLRLLAKTICRFDVDGTVLMEDKEYDDAELDANNISLVLHCRSGRWRQDVKGGKLHSLHWRRKLQDVNKGIIYTIASWLLFWLRTFATSIGFASVPSTTMPPAGMVQRSQTFTCQFKKEHAPGNWSEIEGYNCPKYLADTVFADLTEAQKYDLEQELGCTFTVSTTP